MNSSARSPRFWAHLSLRSRVYLLRTLRLLRVTVHGTVIDPNGAAVPGAKVTMTNKSTNTASTTQTSEEGRFTFNGLLPETYTISVEAPNFKTLTITDVSVQLTDAPDNSRRWKWRGRRQVLRSRPVPPNSSTPRQRHSRRVSASDK